MSTEEELISHLVSPAMRGADRVLIVHAAFRGLSRAGLRAESVCCALRAAMAEGALLMPAMSWRIVTPDNPIFDERETPSHTGVLGEVFRTRFASHRSLHPTHSVAGAGPLAPLLLSQHHRGTTPCAGNSPYGLTRCYDTHVLLIGVGLESCTAIHHIEEMIAPDLYLRSAEEAESYELIDHRGGRHFMRLRRHRRLDRDFPKFAGDLRRRGQLTAGEVHGVPWLALPLRDLYRLLQERLIADDRAVLAE